MASDMTILVLVVVVNVVSGINVSESTGSRMAWMKALFDHHGWEEPLTSGNLTMQQQCREDFETYLAALNSGQLWASRSRTLNTSAPPARSPSPRRRLLYPSRRRAPASDRKQLQLVLATQRPTHAKPKRKSSASCLEVTLKTKLTRHLRPQRNKTPKKPHLPEYTPVTKSQAVYDASGQYSSNVLFGSEYWLGSLNACKDLQLKEYYALVPPFSTGFYVAKINLTIDNDHLPQSRLMLVGECVPASCSAEDIGSLLAAAEVAAAAKASAGGLQASIRTVRVRPVPGGYNIFEDPKLHILGSAVIIVATLMLAASLYEGYLERKYRIQQQKDLELAQNNKQPGNGAVPGKRADNGDKDLRREICGVWSEVLLSFSVLSNGRTILSTDRPSDGALTCLHGMRFMSVIWVIMVHTYLTIFYVADNKTMRVITERNFFYQSVGNASYCVDTFFVISGILVTILFLRTEEKKVLKREQKQDVNKNINGFTNSALSISVISQQSFKEDLFDIPKKSVYTRPELFGMIKNFFILLSYRVVRLTPAYAFVIGLNEIALRWTHDHSVFEPAIFDHVTCDKYWWRNLLYINNLFPQREMCMVWSWYMANDTQFYVVGIILLLISVKHPKIAMTSLGIVMVSSWATTIYISVWHQYKARIQEPFEMFDPLYDKPWSRIGPYLVGIIVGWYLHKTKCQTKLPYWAVAAGWPSALAVMGVLIFSMVDGYFEVWPTAFYISVGHTAWGCAVAWVAISCCSGYGGLVNSALSYRGLLPLSRLTYCAYLVHPTIMMYTSFLLDGPFHMQNSTVIAIYAGYAVLAFLSSFAISIAFEAPAVRLLKIVSGGGRNRSKE